MVRAAGLKDWLIQRVTAVLIGLYAVVLITYLLKYQPLYYAQWHQLFSHLWMRIATVVVLLSILWHAWLGLWVVFTDYVKNRPVRLILEVVVLLLLLTYLVWGLETLWKWS